MRDICIRVFFEVQKKYEPQLKIRTLLISDPRIAMWKMAPNTWIASWLKGDNDD